MRRALRWFGTGLLFVLVAATLTAALLPRLLDQVYYTGPASDHFDGERFFNPGDAAAERRSFALMARFFSGAGRAEWPERVPVTPRKPASLDAAVADAAAGACPPMRGGAIIENWARCVRTTDPRSPNTTSTVATATVATSMVATWIGHATVLVQAGGINVLTDPIFAERASPFLFAGPKRVRAPGIRLADLPRIDIVVVSHSHYDHMDLASLKALWDRDRPLIVTSLGNDAILRAAGVGAVARDWGRRVAGPRGTSVTVERNHHWSSRWGSDRNRALWSSFRIETPAGAIYHAGDTGYGDGRWFEAAAARGPVRLAILPIGAYEPRDVMAENHVNPAEAVRIFDALRPAMALGMHWGTFQLTFEAIDAPPRELARVRGARNFVTSEVGVPVVVPEVGGSR